MGLQQGMGVVLLQHSEWAGGCWFLFLMMVMMMKVQLSFQSWENWVQILTLILTKSDRSRCCTDEWNDQDFGRGHEEDQRNWGFGFGFGV